MPNPYFNFKQFTIRQDNCAMKVCTDACLFGAWVADAFQHDDQHINNILDIGTGTGLLTLILAQKLTGRVDTIEIDEKAYLQAKDNVSKSEWQPRINSIHADIKQLHFEETYDLIISNPPFYEKDLRSLKLQSNMARHDETLTLDSLLSIVSSILSSRGSFNILIPFNRLDYCLHTAGRYHLFPQAIVNVKQSTRHDYFRSMIVFKKHPAGTININDLAIKDGDQYTAAFTALLKDYYLNL